MLTVCLGDKTNAWAALVWVGSDLCQKRGQSALVGQRKRSCGRKAGAAEKLEEEPSGTAKEWNTVNGRQLGREPSRVQSMLSAWLAIFVICRRRKFPGQEVSPIHNHHACAEHVDSGMTDKDKAPWWSIACQTRLTGNKLPIFSLTKAQKHRRVFSTQWKFEYDYDILLINVLHIH